MVTLLPETLHPLCRVYKKAGLGKKQEKRTMMWTKGTWEDLPRMVKAGTRLWPWISAWLAPPDTKPPGWKARFTSGTLLKCAHTLIPMTTKNSTGQELTWIRQELASCWPQNITGMRSSAAAFCNPSSLPAAFWVSSQTYIYFWAFPDSSRFGQICFKYL